MSQNHKRSRYEQPRVPARTLDKLYEEAHDACSAALEEGVLPRDIHNTWPNTLGTLRRVADSKYYRPAPRGSVSEEPTDEEKKALAHYLMVSINRARRALKRED